MLHTRDASKICTRYLDFRVYTGVPWRSTLDIGSTGLGVHGRPWDPWILRYIFWSVLQLSPEVFTYRMLQKWPAAHRFWDELFISGGNVCGSYTLAGMVNTRIAHRFGVLTGAAWRSTLPTRIWALHRPWDPSKYISRSRQSTYISRRVLLLSPQVCTYRILQERIAARRFWDELFTSGGIRAGEIPLWEWKK